MNYLKQPSKIFPSFLLLTILIIFSTPLTSSAQMFSIGDPEPIQTRQFGLYSILGIGWEIATFEHTAGVAAPNELLDFEEGILRIRFNTPGLDLGLGLGGTLTGMGNTSYVNLNARLSNQIIILRRENFRLTLPLQITTDLKSVRRNDSDFEFQLSSFTAGTGLASSLRLGERVDLNLRTTPNYGFSFPQGNIFGGSLFRFDADIYFFVRELFGRHALAIGYNFDYRRYDIDVDLNDYDFTSHAITIGYAF
jgi:hypothetical protein